MCFKSCGLLLLSTIFKLSEWRRMHTLTYRIRSITRFIIILSYPMDFVYLLSVDLNLLLLFFTQSRSFPSLFPLSFPINLTHSLSLSFLLLPSTLYVSQSLSPLLSPFSRSLLLFSSLITVQHKFKHFISVCCWRSDHCEDETMHSKKR